MATLYKRANATQRRILKIVEGAVKNAADAHPSGTLTVGKFARSVAKRAAGTLTAQWPEVLAAPNSGVPSNSARSDTLYSGGPTGGPTSGYGAPRTPTVAMGLRADPHFSMGEPKEGAAQLVSRPLSFLRYFAELTALTRG